ncbi:MAG: hypothetical protein AB8B74_11460 [Crocinitomicaceae bacterium]
MKNVLFALLTIIAFHGFTQESDEWTLFNSISGVEFYHKETDCVPKNIPSQVGLLIKVINTNNYKVEASWNLRIWYDEVEQTTNIRDEENHISLVLDKKSSVAGVCETPTGDLYIFKKFTLYSGGVQMSNFSFDELTIKKIR